MIEAEDFVRSTDAGPTVLLSGSSEQAVADAVLKYEALGYRPASKPIAVGKRWMVTLEKPGEDGVAACTVEQIGLVTMVRGPSEKAVRERIASRLQGGMKLREIVQDGGEWMAVLDASR